MIKIYDETATTFLNNGIATIQPYKCLVYKEDNGSYYVELESPIKDCDYLQQGNIVRVETPWGWQGFRLGNPLKSSKRVKIKGKHIFYDSERYVIKSASVNNSLASTALTTLDDACDRPTPFIYTGTNISNRASLTVERVTLQRGISSVLETWGGHLVRDNWSIAVKATIGADRGVTLAYGKNIKEIEADENWEDVCTKIMPVGKDGLILDEVFLENEHQHKIPYTKIVEFQQDLEKSEAETDEAFTARLKEDLKMQAQAYLASHFEPQVNYTVKAHLNDVTDVGDTIRVKHPKCKIELVTSVIKVVYDAILKRYTSVEFGNYRPQLKDLISTVTKAATESAEKATAKVNERMTAALALATEKIYSYLNDSHIIYGENQILAVDKLPKEKAQKVMQISLGGIAFSKTGINGPFTSAWTLDGTLDMSAINVINLTADMIDVTDLKAFGATIGGWNIGDEAIYKDSGGYRAYLQSPNVAGLDTWILSAQKLNDLANPNFYLTMRGELYLASDLTAKGYITSPNKATFGNTTICENTFAGVLHRRDGAESAFGVGVVSGTKTAALETKATGGKVNARIDVYDGGYGDCVTLGTTQYKETDSKGNDTFYRSYLTFASHCIFAGAPSSSPIVSDMLNFMAKDIYAQTLNAGNVTSDYIASETLVIPVDGVYYDVGYLLSTLLAKK